MSIIVNGQEVPDEAIIEGEVVTTSLTQEEGEPTPAVDTTLLPVKREPNADVASATSALADTTDLMGMLRWGKVLAASGMFNDIQGAAQAVVKVLAGREKGLSPIESLTGIYMVQGRVTYSANSMAAFVKSSTRYDYRIKTLTSELCEITFFERDEEVGCSSFSIKDAQTAGLAQKGVNWRCYPRNMLFARAISNGIKWFCPDLLAGGAYTHGELDD